MVDRRQIEQRSAAFATAIFKFCGLIRHKAGGSGPADQLQAAASSAAANYRAAARGRSPAEFTSKLGISNEEMDETVYWLEYVATTGLAGGPEVQRLTAEAKELRAICAASYATARKNRDKKKSAQKRVINRK
ncbi:MAG TPA: four helix bundle protein [Vicinamibacterales bacterium]|nr:four helix bundle protein [Vicinamibacterales bacterium]